MAASWSNQYLQKVIPPEKLSEKIAEIRKKKKSIVTLNGSFDLLHAGHLHMLHEAAQLGDILIVALNTDKSIQEYKSIHRPIIPLEYRLQMITALEFITYATWFNETDPREILKAIKPDIHVNGSEYGKNCIEAEVVRANGGEIHIVSLIPSLSTTDIVKKIRSLPSEGK